MRTPGYRFFVWAAGLVLMAGCADAPTAPAAARPGSVSVPTAAAGTEAGGASVCSSTTTTEYTFDSLTWAPALLAFDGNPFYPYPPPIPGSFWVEAPSSDGGFPRDTAYFRASFDVPSDARQLALTGSLLAQNQGTVYLNGQQIFQQDYYEGYPNYQNFQRVSTFTDTKAVLPGHNDVVIEVMHKKDTGALVLDFCLTATYSAAVQPPPPPPPPPPGAILAGIVRHAPAFAGGATVSGPLEMLSPENVAIGSGSSMTGPLMVPGMPTVTMTDKASVGAIQDGTGAATPAGYSIALTNKAVLGTLQRRTDPVAMPSVPAPRPPTGTTSITLNGPSALLVDWSTVRDVKVGGNRGHVPMAPGAYGSVSVSGQNTLVLGVTGGTVPALYDFQTLSLGAGGGIQVVGPVILTIGGDVAIPGQAGVIGSPDWLTLRLADGGLSLGGGATLSAILLAPNGTIDLGSGSIFDGGLAADALVLHGSAVLNVTRAIPASR